MDMSVPKKVNRYVLMVLCRLQGNYAYNQFVSVRTIIQQVEMMMCRSRMIDYVKYFVIKALSNLTQLGVVVRTGRAKFALRQTLVFSDGSGASLCQCLSSDDPELYQGLAPFGHVSKAHKHKRRNRSPRKDDKKEEDGKHLKDIGVHIGVEGNNYDYNDGNDNAYYNYDYENYNHDDENNNYDDTKKGDNTDKYDDNTDKDNDDNANSNIDIVNKVEGLQQIPLEAEPIGHSQEATADRAIGDAGDSVSAARKTRPSVLQHCKFGNPNPVDFFY